MREKIIELLEDVLIDGPNDIEACKDLIDGGYLDSMDIVSLVMDLNDEFGVDISVADLKPENFNSVDAMVELVEELS